MHLLTRYAMGAIFVLLCACSRQPDSVQKVAAQPEASDTRAPSITISGDDAGAIRYAWQPPRVELEADDIPAARRSAAAALAEGRLYAEADDAMPLYLAILSLQPEDARAKAGLKQAMAKLLQDGEAQLRDAEDEHAALLHAMEIGAVARVVDPEGTRVNEYLERVDLAERVWALNEAGERDLGSGLLGEQGGGALGSFREVLRLVPGQSRALQGVAAVESAFIRRAEDAARASDFVAAARWLQHASGVREDAQTVEDARLRVDAIRHGKIVALRDNSVLDLQTMQGLRQARENLAEVLRIAEPGNPVAQDLRVRIELATHYGLFRPGQAFTDELKNGGRGPEMVVVPHGGFRMGAGDYEPDAADAEKPAHYVRFDRGFAMARHPVTVGEFRRFVEATAYRPRAVRRGHSITYDERSGNFARRSGVDWQSDYAGAKAADDMPVLHVSVHDAEAYATWLGEQTGRGYRLPSEAEFEYAMRAGTRGRYPWGDGPPPEGVGNLTGSEDESPSGRRWNHAFEGFGDGYWGPAAVASFASNAWGLHDLGSNTSEWVADCWHASFRRAPGDGAAWYNPGCRSRVIRGGSWSNAPSQARAAWRASTDSDTTSARVGFRVVRNI